MSLSLEFINDLFKHHTGISTPPLQFTHFVFSKKAGIANESETLLTDNKEFDRKQITISEQGKFLIITCNLELTTANCEVQTINTVNSNTELIVADAIKFEIGDLIEVQDVNNSFKQRVITNKSGNTIYLNEAITTAPTKKIRQNISRIALVYNGTSARLSGKVYKWFSHEKFKDSSMSYPLEYKLELKG